MTEITLAELPYTDMLTLKKIYDSTLIWYTAPDGSIPDDFHSNGNVKDIPFAHCTNRDELFDKLEESIRTTIIVSDRAGFDLVRAMISGVNWNKTLCNVIIMNNSDGLKAECEEYNQKNEKKKLMLFNVIESNNDDISANSKEAVEAASAGV